MNFQEKKNNKILIILNITNVNDYQIIMLEQLSKPVTAYKRYRFHNFR